MAPVSDERFDAAYQRVLDQMERHRRTTTKPAEHEARQQLDSLRESRLRPSATRRIPDIQTPASANRRMPERQGAGPQPSKGHVPSHDDDDLKKREEGPTEEDTGWDCPLLLPFARAVLAIIWTVAYCAILKPAYKATKIAFVILAVLGIFALMAAWAINVSLGGLHALHVWACNDIFPNRLFFVDWCASASANANANAAHSPLPAATPTLTSSSSSSSSSAWMPLTAVELSLLQKPDRHFCVFSFGDLLGGMADEQRKYMTDKQRESFAVMRQAGSVVGQLRDIGRKQARTVERAQEKMMGLMDDDPAALLHKRHPSHPPAWFGAVWLWGLVAGTQPPSPPPAVTLEELVRDISRVLDGEMTSRQQFFKDVTALSREMGEVASSACGWNTALEESISDKSHRLREAHRRARARARPWWQRNVLFVDRGAGQVMKGTTSDVWLREDQAQVIRNEMIMWRRRKAKANLVCKMLTEGASKTAKLLKAIQDEKTHLAEMAQGAADLVADVSGQGGQASENMLQRWSKTARDLGVSYLQSFRQYYPKC